MLQLMFVGKQKGRCWIATTFLLAKYIGSGYGCAEKVRSSAWPVLLVKA